MSGSAPQDPVVDPDDLLDDTDGVAEVKPGDVAGDVDPPGEADNEPDQVDPDMPVNPPADPA